MLPFHLFTCSLCGQMGTARDTVTTLAAGTQGTDGKADLETLKTELESGLGFSLLVILGEGLY
jgi:hypothetical protein